MVKSYLDCVDMSTVTIFFLYVGLVVTINAQFATQPISAIQASELEAEFKCRYSRSGATQHNWRINGMTLLDAQFPDSFTRIPPSTDSPEARLIIPATPQYNNTVVQCEALVPIEGGVFAPVRSNNATLTVQNVGLLELKVTNHTITIFWNNPFTTNLTFCVDAVSVVSSETLASVCVSGTQYTFTSLDTDLCEEVSFTVTPTDRERNGTNTSSRPILGFVQERRNVLTVQCPKVNVTKNGQCELIIPSPLNCEIKLTFTTSDATDLPSINYVSWISGDGNTAYELSSVIVANRRYLVNIVVTTSSDRRLLHNLTVSTHDIVEASATMTSDGALNTSCTFVANTTARGYLVVISAISCKSHEDTMFSAQYNTAGTGDIVKGVGRGQYIINFFDLENDGLPVHSRTDSPLIGSAFSTEVNISTDTQSQFPNDSLEEAAVSIRDNDSACIRCSSHMDCLVLLYDCTTPDLLVTLFVPATEKRCLALQDKNYSVAFYGIDNLSKLLNNSIPGKVAGITLNSQIPTLDPTTPWPIAALSVIAVTTIVVALIGIQFSYKKKKKSKPEFSDKSSPGSPVISGSSNEYEKVFSDKSSIHSIWSPVMSGSSSEYEQELNVAYAVRGKIQIGTLEKKSVNDDETHNRYSEVTGRPHQMKSIAHEPAYAVPDSGLVGTSEQDQTDTTFALNTYAEITGHQHHMQVYTHVVIQTDQTLPGDRRNVRQVEYAEIDRDKLITQVSHSEPNEKEIPSPIPDSTVPPDTSTLHSLLSPAANKWFEIGLAMGFSEDTLQGEIYHDNSTDWLRLEEVCMLYCRYKPSWEEVVRLLWEVEEWEIADKICRQEKLEIERPFNRTLNHLLPFP